MSNTLDDKSIAEDIFIQFVNPFPISLLYSLRKRFSPARDALQYRLFSLIAQNRAIADHHPNDRLVGRRHLAFALSVAY